MRRRRFMDPVGRGTASAWSLVAIATLLVAASAPVNAIPAFARKYGTSCLTCHTIYPKLTPFGEAFRRNGFRFPGVDSDFVKQEAVALGQEAQKKEFPNAVWPGTLPTSAPIAIGFNGQAVIHPDKGASAAKADNGATLNLTHMVEEGHLWAGGSFDDEITFFGEVTFADGGAELEHVSVHFNDLAGPKHALNVVAGKIAPTLSSFGAHASYLADMTITPLFVTALYGATSDSWNVVDAYGGIEVNGTVKGRLDYTAGANAGANVDTRSTDDYYAHVGYKFGGMPLDAEGASAVPDPKRPWAENALALDAFYYRSVSRYTPGGGIDLTDEARTVGGGIRAQRGSMEISVGAYQERHDHATADGGGVRALAGYTEASYVFYPWLVPALRLEYLRLKPGGAPAVWDARAMAGVASLVRPNLKLTLAAWIEKAQGAPDGGWGAASGLAVPPGPTDHVGVEVEAIMIGMAYAF
jgi:thiol-disulfide isomerase/thioredoxin